MPDYYDLELQHDRPLTPERSGTESEQKLSNSFPLSKIQSLKLSGGDSKHVELQDPLTVGIHEVGGASEQDSLNRGPVGLSNAVVDSTDNCDMINTQETTVTSVRKDLFHSLDKLPELRLNKNTGESQARSPNHSRRNLKLDFNLQKSSSFSQVEKSQTASPADFKPGRRSNSVTSQGQMSSCGHSGGRRSPEDGGGGSSPDAIFSVGDLASPVSEGWEVCSAPATPVKAPVLMSDALMQDVIEEGEEGLICISAGG